MNHLATELNHRHEDYETGHILRVNPRTGEIVTRRVMVLRKNLEAEYQAWAAQRRADDTLAADYMATQKGFPMTTPVVEVVVEQCRGRPKTKKPNPAAVFMPLLVIPEVLNWVDDIIHGSILSSAGTSNGKINVRPRAVIGALFLPEISAEACQTSEHTLRTAQRIAKAARHAADGLASFIERHPSIKARLEAELAPEALYQAMAT